jgi:thiamine-monophosphate kinase
MSKITSENHVLSLIDAYFPRRHPSLLLGRGDDCAEFVSASPLALSSDLFLEQVHFRRSYFTAEEVGHKALAVNLSDLAAAGARPLGFSLGLICPADLDADWLEAMFKGMAALARESDIPLAGGDISAGNSLGFCITVWGSAANAQSLFLRRGAEVGDILFTLSPQNPFGVCELGLARLGLEVLEKQGRAAINSYPAACAALLAPKPMLAAGQALSALLLESSRQDQPAHIKAPIHVMDLSDGLARDLPRLLSGLAQQFAAGAEFDRVKTGSRQGYAANLGADLNFEAKNLHPELRAYYAGSEQKALGMALSGGDEYALLCACSPEKLDILNKRLRDAKPFMQILGTVSEVPGIRWQGIDIGDMVSEGGFDHFKA